MDIIKMVLKEELHNSLKTKELYEAEIQKLSKNDLAKLERYSKLLATVKAQIIYLEELLAIK